MNNVVKFIGGLVISLCILGLSFVSGIFVGKRDVKSDTIVIGHELPKDTIFVNKLLKSVQIRVEHRNVPVLVHDTVIKDEELQNSQDLVFQSELKDSNIHIVHTYAAQGIVLWDSTKYELFPRPVEFRTQTKDISKHWIAGITVGKNFINPMIGYRIKDYIFLAGYKVAENPAVTFTALKFIK